MVTTTGTHRRVFPGADQTVTATRRARTETPYRLIVVMAEDDGIHHLETEAGVRQPLRDIRR